MLSEKKNTSKDNFWLFQLESSLKYEIEYYYFEAGTGRNLSNASQSLLKLKLSYALTRFLGSFIFFQSCMNFLKFKLINGMGTEQQSSIIMKMGLFPNRNNFRKYIKLFSSFIYTGAMLTKKRKKVSSFSCIRCFLVLVLLIKVFNWLNDFSRHV